MSFFLNSYSFSIPPAVACDPYWSYVTLLLHMDGANNGTSFPDSSAYNHTITASGNAKTTTGHASKFGSASVTFDGTGDYLTTPANAAFSFGAEDWTVEGWVYQDPAAGVSYTLFDNRLSSATGCAIYTSTNASRHKLVYATNAVEAATSTIGITPQTWVHIAVTRAGNTVRGFIDGALAFTYTETRTFTGDSCRIGANSSAAQGFLGEVDEVRVTKGIARYTATFTPPTAAFATTQCTYTGWTPANGTAPYAWYITDDPANTVSGGVTLTNLVDKSGNGRHISTSLEYAAGAMHSRAAASTGFGGKRLTLPSSTGMLNGAAGWCAAFSLYRIDGGAMSQALFFAETNALNTSRALLAVEGPTDDKPRIVSRRANGDSAAVLDASGTVGNQDYALVVGGVDLASQTARVRANGTETVGTSFGTAGSAFSTTDSYSGPYLLDSNASGSGGSEQYIGNVGEIVLYNGPISQAEMEKLDGYLAWTWGMLDKLPSDHPYKTTQPPV